MDSLIDRSHKHVWWHEPKGGNTKIRTQSAREPLYVGDSRMEKKTAMPCDTLLAFRLVFFFSLCLGHSYADGPCSSSPLNLRPGLGFYYPDVSLKHASTRGELFGMLDSRTVHKRLQCRNGGEGGEGNELLPVVSPLLPPSVDLELHANPRSLSLLLLSKLENRICFSSPPLLSSSPYSFPYV